MIQKVLQVHPQDNVLVALVDLPKDESVRHNGEEIILKEPIQAKHKFLTTDLQAGESIIMYGVLVGKAQTPLKKGQLISTGNVKHASESYRLGERKLDWQKPDVSRFADRHFMGYHRADGKVGTANYWLVIPMVFCENRNVDVLKELFLEGLGFKKRHSNYLQHLTDYIRLKEEGKTFEEILNTAISPVSAMEANTLLRSPHFPNVDGIRFLEHQGGCGGTRKDSDALCGLLAGYITNPNVAGATVLSLGCQNAQTSQLEQEINRRNPGFNKPLFILEQQKLGTENELIAEAIRKTFAGLMIANENSRSPAPLSKLCIGLECGGSDGFSGISANPAIGYTSDLLVNLGGTVILAEFPELCGVEQELSNRCIDEPTAYRFMDLMTTYNNRAKEAGSGFDMNPSPGNIKDGLITDAIKSAGAAKKGGTSPIVDVLDYPHPVTKPGLNLLCTPGNDVESTTAEVGSGANLVLFTTGLGTPTGNPIAPVIKISSNTSLYNRMHDIIDINTGTIIEGNETISQAGERILDHVIKVASGEIPAKAMVLGQEDFIPWKRGVSL